MSELATSEREIVLFYNPDTPVARNVLGYVATEGLPIREVDIIKTPLTGVQLEEIAGMLSVSIGDLVNKNHDEFSDEMQKADLDDNGWIHFLQKNPKFLRQPIAIRGKKAIFAETASLLSRL